MDPFWRLLYWDQMWFQGATPKLNLIYVSITPACIAFYYRMYFYRSPRVAQGMETIPLVKMVLEKGQDPRFLKDAMMHVNVEKMKLLVEKYLCLLQYLNLFIGM